MLQTVPAEEQAARNEYNARCEAVTGEATAAYLDAICARLDAEAIANAPSDEAQTLAARWQ